MQQEATLQASSLVLSEQLIEDLGLVKVDARAFKKVVTPSVGYDHCTIVLADNGLISIKAGLQDKDYQHQLLKLFYVPDEKAFIETLERLPLLSTLFPEIKFISQF